MTTLRAFEPLRGLVAAVMVAVAIGGCASGPSATARESEPAASSSMSSEAPSGLASVAPSIVDPTPSNPTPQAVIDAFLSDVRSPTIRFHVEAAGSYFVGARTITYVEHADVHGADRTVELDETVDGVDHPQSIAFVDGLLYTRADAQAWNVDGGIVAAQFGAAELQLGHTLVLGDLGATTVDGRAAYKLRVASGVDLFPPQLVDGTVASPHNPQGRLEFTIDNEGVLLSAHETRSVDGIIGGTPAAASGTIDFQFSQFGSAGMILAPKLDPGTAVPTPQPLATALPTAWMTPLPGDRGFSVSFPEAPTESSATSMSSISGGSLTVETREVAYPSGLRFFEQDAVFPETFLATTNVSDVLAASQRAGLAQSGGQLVGSIMLALLKNLPNSSLRVILETTKLDVARAMNPASQSGTGAEIRQMVGAVEEDPAVAERLGLRGPLVDPPWGAAAGPTVGVGSDGGMEPGAGFGVGGGSPEEDQ